jgi:gamma-glutamyl-gamma-aminobutyrate hydrolase PuuD
MTASSKPWKALRPDHFRVLAVQWHPERSVDDDEHSRAIFRTLIEAAKIQAEAAHRE